LEKAIFYNFIGLILFSLTHVDLKVLLHVFPYDTKDDAGGERYMPFTPGHHFQDFPDGSEGDKKDWYRRYSIDVKFGADHCAARSVAFHYITPDLMNKMHAILYGHCHGAT